MRLKRFFFVTTFMLVATLNFSCEEQSTAEEDQLYGIDRDEITEDDT